ncbi:unnamed protein product [Sphagnum troendelagicum]|uniref:Uncharacterized protein n=1 Tax=Sphagnum troendelagicum TaxID=128251 RepID=A0ABP0T7A8_9BRYO
MQQKADEVMKEELTDDDDFADWMQWVVDEERRMQSVSEAVIAAEESVLLQMQQLEIVDSRENVRRSAWFSALDLQSGFWQIKMAPEDMGKTALITKSGSIVFLGHVVSKEGTRPDPSKVDDVRKFPVPATVTNEHQSAFDELKKALVQAPILHANVDALSQNPVGQAADDEDFRQEIQDDPVTQHGTSKEAEKVLAVRNDQQLQWFEKLRRYSGMADHHRRGFGINHGGSLNPHHLFMIDAVDVVERREETNPELELTEAREDEELDMTVVKQRPKKGQFKYYNRRQQLELVLAAQELSGIDDREGRAEMEEEGAEVKSSDIWLDATCLALLKEGTLPELIGLEEGRRARKRIAAQFLENVELIASIHKDVLLNIGEAQKKQRSTYVCRKGKHLFEGLTAGETMAKMKRPGKKRTLAASWEGPYQFVGHVDGKGDFDFEEGFRLCVVRDADGKEWERSRRDLQIFHMPPD